MHVLLPFDTRSHTKDLKMQTCSPESLFLSIHKDMESGETIALHGMPVQFPDPGKVKHRKMAEEIVQKALEETRNCQSIDLTNRNREMNKAGNDMTTDVVYQLLEEKNLNFKDACAKLSTAQLRKMHYDLDANGNPKKDIHNNSMYTDQYGYPTFFWLHIFSEHLIATLKKCDVYAKTHHTAQVSVKSNVIPQETAVAPTKSKKPAVACVRIASIKTAINLKMPLKTLAYLDSVADEMPQSVVNFNKKFTSLEIQQFKLLNVTPLLRYNTHSNAWPVDISTLISRYAQDISLWIGRQMCKNVLNSRDIEVLGKFECSPPYIQLVRRKVSLLPLKGKWGAQNESYRRCRICDYFKSYDNNKDPGLLLDGTCARWNEYVCMMKEHPENGFSIWIYTVIDKLCMSCGSIMFSTMVGDDGFTKIVNHIRVASRDYQKCLLKIYANQKYVEKKLESGIVNCGNYRVFYLWLRAIMMDSTSVSQLIQNVELTLNILKAPTGHAIVPEANSPKKCARKNKETGQIKRVKRVFSEKELSEQDGFVEKHARYASIDIRSAVPSRTSLCVPKFLIQSSSKLLELAKELESEEEQDLEEFENIEGVSVDDFMRRPREVDNAKKNASDDEEEASETGGSSSDEYGEYFGGSEGDVSDVSDVGDEEDTHRINAVPESNTYEGSESTQKATHGVHTQKNTHGVHTQRNMYEGSEHIQKATVELPKEPAMDLTSIDDFVQHFLQA